MMMRKILSAAFLAGLAIAGSVQAQPYGYYTGSGAEYAYRYAPPRAYDGNGRYTPYSYYNGYDGYNPVAPSGAAMASAATGRPANDQYGPDPAGLAARDGHRIECKLVSDWNDYARRYVARRVCW
jgi:hypothetical protein